RQVPTKRGGSPDDLTRRRAAPGQLARGPQAGCSVLQDNTADTRRPDKLRHFSMPWAVARMILIAFRQLGVQEVDQAEHQYPPEPVRDRIERFVCLALHSVVSIREGFVGFGSSII